MSNRTETLPVSKPAGWQKILQNPALQEGFGLLAMYIIIVVVMSLLSPCFLSTRNFLNLLLVVSSA
ncbi:MAG: hypothetical protein U0401_24545 [Anaerolineae bacterium]